ncbi:hypothetical protein IFM61606_09564 [Aspergillus udagawae]|nr:hypothetical protein IFM61606_09564 [Aspergillus udagawae]
MRVVKSWAIALLAWALLIFEVLAQHGHGHGSHVHLHRQLSIDSMGTDRALDAPLDAIAKVRALVKDAIAKAAPAPPLFNVTEEIADAEAELNATGTVKREHSHIDILHGRHRVAVLCPTQQGCKRAALIWKF